MSDAHAEFCLCRRKREWMRGLAKCGSSCQPRPPLGPCCSCWQAAGRWPGLGAILPALLLSGCCSGTSAMRCCKPSGVQHLQPFATVHTCCAFRDAIGVTRASHIPCPPTYTLLFFSFMLCLHAEYIHAVTQVPYTR